MIKMFLHIGWMFYSNIHQQELGCGMCWIQANEPQAIDCEQIMTTLQEALDAFCNDCSESPVFPMHDVIYTIAGFVGRNNPVECDLNLQHYGAREMSKTLINPVWVFCIENEESGELEWYKMGDEGSIEEKARELTELLCR